MIAPGTAVERFAGFKLYSRHERTSLHHDCYCLFANRIAFLGICDLLLRQKLLLQIKWHFNVLPIVCLLLWIFAVVRVFVL